METGALGVGAAVDALATTVAVDVTGFAAANLIAGLGPYILPDKRRRPATSSARTQGPCASA